MIKNLYINKRTTPYKWIVMSFVSIGVFMSTLDGSIVNVALPGISKYFNTSITTIEWVLTAYFLTITGLLLIIGRLSDIIGRKKIFFAGFLVFTVGSGLCAISGNENELIFFRIIQGFGAAMIMAISPAIIAHEFPEAELSRAFGLIGAVIGIGSMTGPVLGGFLIENLGWRSIFYVNIPIGIIGLFCISYYMQEGKDLNKDRKFDVIGAGALFISLFSLLMALSTGQDMGWGSLFITTMIISFIIFLILFIVIENDIEYPIIELHLFSNRNFSAANITLFISFIAMFAVLFIMPFFLEKVSNYPVSRTGMALFAIPLFMALTAPISGRISNITNSHLFIRTGMIIICISILLISRLNGNSDFINIASRLGLLGIGLGFFQSPNNSIIMRSIPKQRLGIASGMMATMRSLGMVMGIAIAGAVFSYRLNKYPEDVYVNAFQDTYVVITAISLIGLIASFLIKREGNLSNDKKPGFINKISDFPIDNKDPLKGTIMIEKPSPEINMANFQNFEKNR